MDTMSEQEAVPSPEQPSAMVTPAAGGVRLPRWAVRAAVAVLAACVAAGLVAVGRDDLRLHQAVAQQARRASELDAQLAAERARDSGLSTSLAAAQAENGSLRAEARNPTLTMWNACAGPCTISASEVRVGSVPDTFQLQIDFTSDVPVRTYVFTFHQWTQFDDCGFSLRCVTGDYRAFDATTSLHQTVDDAEGCSAYVWVLQADGSGTIKPDVKVRYLPADQPTGACA